MRIAIEARALSMKGGGVATYVRQLISHLVKLNANDEWLVILDSANSQSLLHGARVQVVPRRGDLQLLSWLWWKVPRIVRGFKADVVHFTKAAVPLTSDRPTVVTIYDIIPVLFPESQTFSRRLYWPWILSLAAKQDNHIITISETSKRDIVERYQIDPGRVTVTPLAVNTEHFYPRSEDEIAHVQSSLDLSRPYILFVGRRDIRKNVSLLVRAFSSICRDVPHQLVVAGEESRGGDNARQVARELHVTDRVTFLDHISYDDLPGLYSGADIFVWPSVYEGWGFPPQEAMACGVPVVVSDGGALPEVVGEAGEVVKFKVDDLKKRTSDKEFERELAGRLRAVLADEDRKTRMRQRGLERITQFSWEKVARQTYNVYVKAAHDGK